VKRTLALILILAVSLAPAFVFAQDGVTLEDTYIASDSQLLQLIETYAELLEARDEDIEKYENMRLNTRGGSFYFAMSQASREKGIVQVDYTIENAYDSIKAREAQLVIDFRNSIAGLYSKLISALDAKEASDEAKSEYEISQRSNQSGFISYNTLLKLEYSTIQAENSALSLSRSYESALRSFNYRIGNPLAFDEYDFDFTEDINELEELDFYLSHALANSPTVKIAQQNLKKLYIDRKYFNQFSFSGRLSYIKDALRELDINIRLAELNLEKAIKNLGDSLTDQYNSLIIEREKLDLAELFIELKQNEYDINISLYERGYIGMDELSASKETLYNAEDDYVHAIFKYNTMIKSFELNCAYFPEESDGQ
jgi:outer membrane protein TolC